MSTDQLSIPIGVRLQLSDRFVQLLAREIASSTYAAGDLLPGEAMLALRYGVSKPTILKLLGLDPHELEAVRIEGTQPLF